MNPFAVSKEEFNIEKTEFLTNLIFLIWQGADATVSPTQKSVLDNALLAYYQQHFEGHTDWHKDKNDEDLLLYLNKYNVYDEDLNYDEEQTYYDVLGLPYNATTDEIKKRARKLMQEYHPDKNRNKQDYNPENYFKIYEAYDTLSDEERRKAYNESAALIMVRNEREVAIIEEDELGNGDSHRRQIIKRIKKIEDDFNVPALSFNSFYEFCEKFLPVYLNNRHHKITEEEFNLRTFLFVLKDFYKGGRYGTTLNQNADNSLFYEPFIVFEIDNVKDNPKLFPIVTLIIMDTFIQKMRLRSDRRKALIIEEAWKAIASKLMGGYILYLYKTVRKFWGEAVVVTQELDDIIGNAVVKDSIINNSDTFILLDQTKFKDNFDRIAALLSLNKVEQNKIFTINNLDNKTGRGRFKEFYLKRGPRGEVYGNEVSMEQYLTYTTEKPEKSAILHYVNALGSYDKALDAFVADVKKYKEKTDAIYALVNLYKKPLDDKVVKFFKDFKKENPKDTLKKFDLYVKEQNKPLAEIIP